MHINIKELEKVINSLSKKKNTIEYWNIIRILQEEADYNIVYGERSNGKTYGTLLYCLIDYFYYKNEFAYIRRWDDDLVGKKGESLFNGLIKNGVIRKLSKGKWNHIVYKSRSYYMAFIDDDGTITTDVKPFAYAFALTQHEHYKSNSYPDINNIIFDEFLTRGAYLPDEFITFQNVLSTIIRLRDDVHIFMLGNSVNKYSPYIEEMGLYKMREQKIDTIDVYKYNYENQTLKVAVEYSNMRTTDKKSNKFFAFKNERLNMIRNGAWEIGAYPHYPRDQYTGIDQYKDIKFTFFIEFGGSILQCEVIYKEKDINDKVNPCYFLFVHPKTTPIKEDENPLIYSQEPNPKANYHRRLTKATTKVDRKILRFFAKDKVFYSDNETGEVMRNYLLWCQS